MKISNQNDVENVDIEEISQFRRSVVGVVWTTPIVLAVSLPIHATTSDPDPGPADPTDPTDPIDPIDPIDPCEGVVPESGTQIFSYTGAEETFTVPDCVTSINITALGASGGSGSESNTSGVAEGGLGGSATGTLAVTGGEVLYIYVGGEGLSQVVEGSDGGFNGGGNNGFASCSTGLGGGISGTGGGASDVRQGGSDLSSRVIVAGGGGGAGQGGPAVGGDGGGLTGGDGVLLKVHPANGIGEGATQTAGGVTNFGSRDTPGTCPALNTAGSFGQGGIGHNNDGGGGGGGYYGGGGGGSNSGAGGGSSYIGGMSSGSTNSGVNSGNGQVEISW